MASTLTGEAEEQVQLHLSCHCRTFATTLALPSSAFPLKSALCHCTACRQISGHSFITLAVIPLPDRPSTDGLASYEQTPSVARWFCKTCGASVWDEDRANSEWEIATGMIDGVTRMQGQNTNKLSNPGAIDGLLKRTQLFVEPASTGDGGAAIWLNGGLLEGMDRKLDDRKSPSVTDEMLHDIVGQARNALLTTSQSPDLTVTAHCACKRIQMSITRPDTKTKYGTGLDACTSCRKISGFEITSWATVPINHITFITTENHKPLNFNDDHTDPSSPLSLLTRYETSDGRVSRYFCPGCGATVFYRLLSRETTIDVGAGLFEFDEKNVGRGGCRLEGWLRWDKYQNPRVIHSKDAADSAFVRKLVEGIERDDDQVKSFV